MSLKHMSSSSSTTLNSKPIPSIANNNMIINMRVTANSSQGHRKYMEDCYKIRFQRDANLDTNNNNNDNRRIADAQQSDILFSFFAIFDGHGGKEAAQYCKEKLFWNIIESDDFWSDDDGKILGAIREGFVKCHMNMWEELPNWPKTPSGLPSTSGSTATILFIRKSKAYVGHVGDSGLVIGYTKTMTSSKADSLNTPWYGKKLTRDHKPEDPVELKRIQSLGGSVMTKSGVNRVVWNRPVFNSSNSCTNLAQYDSKSEIRSSINRNSASIPFQLNYLKNQPDVPTERIPFLAVARSLGDLWSYEMKHDDFLVSPVPDVFAFELDPRIHKCLVLATDGLWNVLRAGETVELIRQTDKETEQMINRTITSSRNPQPFVNPSQRLVNTAIQRCCEKMIRADNTTCITIMLDQPDDLDMDETLNRTSFDRLISNKTVDFTRRFNDSDEFEDEYDEIEEDEEFDDDDNTNDNEEEEDDDEGISSNRRNKLSKTLSATGADNMLSSTAISEEFNTPLSNDKRSRSLISLRRRHWSASSNRSSSTTTTVTNTASTSNNNNNNNNNRNNFINVEDRSRRKLFNGNNQNVYDVEKSYVGTSSSNINYNNQYFKNSQQPRGRNSATHAPQSNLNSTEIYLPRQYANQRQQHQQNQHQMSSIFNNRTFNQRHKSNLNTSSVSNLTMNLNKFSKNLRKSFNDLYSATASKLNSTSSVNTVSQNKREISVKNHLENNDSKKKNPFRNFKNRLIKTKNSLFSTNNANKKRKSASVSELNSKTDSSAANKNGIMSDQASNKNTAQALLHYNDNDDMNSSQSFVSSVKMKFLKRNRSARAIVNENENNQNGKNNLINSNNLSTKLSNTYLSNRQPCNINSNNNLVIHHQIYEHSPNKRPKFY